LIKNTRNQINTVDITIYIIQHSYQNSTQIYIQIFMNVNDVDYAHIMGEKFVSSCKLFLAIIFHKNTNTDKI